MPDQKMNIYFYKAVQSRKHKTQQYINTTSRTVIPETFWGEKNQTKQTVEGYDFSFCFFL